MAPRARFWGPPGGTNPAPSTRHEVLSDLGSSGPALKGLCCSQPAFGSRRLLLRLRAIIRRAGAAYARLPCSAPGSGGEAPGVYRDRVGRPHAPRRDGRRRNEETPQPKPSLRGISFPADGDMLLSASRPTPQAGGTRERMSETRANLTDRQITCALSVSPMSQPYGHVNHSHRKPHQSALKMTLQLEKGHVPSVLSPSQGKTALVPTGCETGLSITLARVTPEGHAQQVLTFLLSIN